MSYCGDNPGEDKFQNMLGFTKRNSGISNRTTTAYFVLPKTFFFGAETGDHYIKKMRKKCLQVIRSNQSSFGFVKGIDNVESSRGSWEENQSQQCNQEVTHTYRGPHTETKCQKRWEKR